MQFKHTNHSPTPKQKQLYRHFDACAKAVAKLRQGKRLIVVHDGDAIEGVHHDSSQNVTRNKAEQCKIHIELMDHFLQTVNYGKRDTLYYVSGTETHVGDDEEGIGADLGAQETPEGGYVHDHLELDVNGALLWFAHHGSKRGAGANEGNGLRNFLRDVYFDCLKRRTIPPDCIITGHTHTPTWNTYIVREPTSFREVHGIICPSWQMKTRYAYKIAPVEVNEIGMVALCIGADGRIDKPKFYLMETK